jgi:peptidyl-prolyl cis-trans isomerase C
VQQVLISTKSRDDKEAKALADTVATEAKAHPDQFDALVQKYSDGESKAGNGLVTGVTKATYGAPFLDAAKALKKPGDISVPVKTKDGYRVVKLVSRAADKQLAFAEVHDRIVERLKGDYVDKAVKQHVDEIRNQHVEANPALVASLRTRYGTAAPADPVSLDSIGAPSAQP